MSGVHFLTLYGPPDALYNSPDGANVLLNKLLQYSCYIVCRLEWLICIDSVYYFVGSIVIFIFFLENWSKYY